LKLEFVHDDMREFCRPAAFDVVLNLFTAFGYFEDQADDLRVVQNVHQSLKPDGRFLLDVMGKEVLARIYRERAWREQDGLLILEERKLSKNWSWIDNRWILIKDTERTEFDISHRLYSAVELTTLLREGGFRTFEVYGDLKGSPYDETAKRLVVVACR
jgi:SAM-dependent methyltransferase